MIAVIDYGAGNLKNVSKAFDFLGMENIVTDNPETILSAEKAVLPGVGSFGVCMGEIQKRGLDMAIKEFVSLGKPFLGICLGMQLLFDESEESPGVSGLGLLRGKILRIPEKDGLKIPHMGWNDIKCHGKLFSSFTKNPYMYFVHSYHLEAADKSIVSATVEYGKTLEVAVEYKNIFATQFHPEKSGSDGLKILSAFANLGAETL